MSISVLVMDHRGGYMFLKMRRRLCGFSERGGAGGGVPGNCFERICATFFSHFMKFWGPQKAGGGGGGGS